MASVHWHDAVVVRGITFEANHGYTDQEQRQTRRFCVDIELSCSLSAASDSDALAETVDYRQVCEIVVETGTRSTHRLLEAVAGRIISAIHDVYPQVGVRLFLQKMAPPCPGVPRASGVRMTRPPRG